MQHKKTKNSKKCNKFNQIKFWISKSYMRFISHVRLTNRQIQSIQNKYREINGNFKENEYNQCVDPLSKFPKSAP